MIHIDLTLKPVNNGIHIDRIGVKIRFHNIEKQESFLFGIHKNTVGKEFLPFSKKLKLRDKNGTMTMHSQEESFAHITKEYFHGDRVVEGDPVLSYECAIGPVGKNPVFDLGYEDGGINGSGMTFLPFFPKGEYNYTLRWDLKGLRPGEYGVWSYGEGKVKIQGDENTLIETLYCAGQLEKVQHDVYGYYWHPNVDLPGRIVGEYVMDLFPRMAEFFGDGHAPYQIFSRKLPEALTGRNKMGGTALRRSFEYVYSMEHPPSPQNLKFLFPHEMIHNWLTLWDEPFGSGTWYVEGTAEFYSVVLPDRFHMIQKEELVEQLNKRARDYYENPRNSISNKEAGELLFQDSEATLVPYGRGFFYLLHVDHQIRQMTDHRFSLDDVVFALLRRTRNHEHCGNQDWLEEVHRITGLDIREEFEEMQRGKIFAPQVSSFVTPIQVRPVDGRKRETQESCVSYEFYEKRG